LIDSCYFTQAGLELLNSRDPPVQLPEKLRLQKVPPCLGQKIILDNVLKKKSAVILS
jgi:hypothetical protein